MTILALGIYSLIRVDEVKPVDSTSMTTEDEIAPSDPENWETILKTGTKGELLEALVGSEDRKVKNNPVMIYVESLQRAKMGKRLLQMDLSEAQEHYATLAYLQSLRAAEVMNVAAKLKFKGSREEVQAAAQEYGNDPRPEIAGAASLTPILVYLYDFWSDSDLRHLELVRTEFDQNYQKVLSHPNVAAQFVAVIFRLNKDPDYPNETTTLLLHVLNEFEKVVTPETADVLTSFRDLLFFADLSLPTLPQEVVEGDPFASERTRRLFDILARTPEAGPKVYRTAIRVISSYREIGEEQLAKLFQKRLRDTAMKIANDEKRELTLAEIENPQLIPEESEEDETDLGIDLEVFGGSPKK